jgi:glycosyltransferase involved in cell wall biosynthesis
MTKIKIHTVDQPDSDTTTYVLSCDRLEILDRTLQSFFATRDYPTKMVIVDDSARPGVFETLVERYGHLADVICFPRNRSQWWAMDFMVSYCDTEYIFYLEDDWELTRPGYLTQSRQILERHRDVGVVDISWRTFEFQGIDSYERELIDGQFYWKKPWKITDEHLAWYIWCGSPNLKRRDDLIMLGRVEKWHNEWNIDRKFVSLGFRGVFLDGEYARHLGDDCSRMADRRPDDGKTPYDYYPPEVLARRTMPKIDYLGLDHHYTFPADVTLVSCLLDLGRHDRDFATHYLQGLDHLLTIRNPLVIYAEEQYHDYIRQRRRELSIATSDNKVTLKPLSLDTLHDWEYYQRVRDLIRTSSWRDQSAWMKDSVISSDDYIPLTLLKFYMLQDVARENPHRSKRFYWVDSGIVNSFGIREPLTNFDFLKLPQDHRVLMSSFPYYTLTEIHGYNINTMATLLGTKPNYVCRATIFGGSKPALENFAKPYTEAIETSLEHGSIGAEEAIFTMVEHQHPDLINRFVMPNGDIKNLLDTIRK